MRKKPIRPGVEAVEKRNLLSTVDPLSVMPPAAIAPTPAPAPVTMPPTSVEPAPVEVAFNPDITRFPGPIQSDPNPVLTLFQVSSGQATIVDPAKVPTTPPLAAPKPTMPPLPPPLPTGLPILPRAPLFP